MLKNDFTNPYNSTYWPNRLYSIVDSQPILRIFIYTLYSMSITFLKSFFKC